MKPTPLLPLLTLAVAVSSGAAELKQGRVTQVINEVQLLPESAAARPAAINDEVRDHTAVRTGADSRGELKFSDLTIARLGANTIFTINEGTRTVDLGSGAILLRVPKNSGGAKITTAAVTAAITGTTIMAEYHKNSIFKFIMLEGTAQICRQGGQDCVDLGPGQMLAGVPGQRLGKAVTVDLNALTESSRLLIEDFGPLGSEDLIAQAIEAQQTQYVALAPAHENSLEQYIDAADQRIAASPTPNPSASPTASPSPSATPSPSASPTPTATPSPSPSPSATPTPSPSASPSKNGPLQTITSANLSTIDSSTTLETDPLITRNGETGSGRIYRGPQEDGTPSSYFFDSTSSFDVSSGFNSIVGDTIHLPIAAFRFQSLIIAGNPTISTGNGGPTNLALISVGNLTSSAPGGALNFTGIDGLLLATQNGSIVLGSEVSFEGLPALLVYARGANSNLTFDASVNGTRDFGLISQGDIVATDSLTVAQTNVSGGTQGLEIFLFANRSIRIGSDLNLSTDLSNVTDGANITVIAGSDLSLGGNLFLRTSSNASSGNGGNLLVDIGGNLTANRINMTAAFAISRPQQSGENLRLSVDGDLVTQSSISLQVITPVRQTLSSGANLTLEVGGNLNTGAGQLFLFINNNINTVTNGANLSVNIGGNLTTSLLDLELLNEDGEIDNGGIVNFTVGGSLTTSSNASFLLDNFSGVIVNGGSIRITIGGDMTIGGSLNALIDSRGSSQEASEGGPLLSLQVGGNLSVGGRMRVSGSVGVGGNVTAQELASTMVTAARIDIGSGGIRPFFYDDGRPDVLHVLTASRITSFGGINFDGDFSEGNGSGGRLILNVNSISFDAEGDIVGNASFNGGDNPDANSAGGDGGFFAVDAAGNITVNTLISATTGLNGSSQSFGGAGGSVSLDSSDGIVTINGRIQVSSDDASEGFSFRRSASAGDISLHSGLTTGTAIDLSAGSQLLSLLDEAAPGPGGLISIRSDGGNIIANGTIRADRGTIIISNTGDSLLHLPLGNPVPLITLDGSNLNADTINISSAGNLNIGVNSGVGLNATSFSLVAADTIRFGSVSSFAPSDNTDGNIFIDAGGNFTTQGALQLSRSSGGSRQDGNNIDIIAANDIMIGGFFGLETDGTGLNSGGGISVNAGRDLSALGVQVITLVNNSLGSGADLFLNAGRDIVTGAVFASVELGPGAVVNSGATINVLAARDVVALGLGKGGGLDLAIINGNGGHITDGGNITVGVGHNLNTASYAAIIEIGNRGGSIVDGGNIVASISGAVTAGLLELVVDDGNGGTIDNGGNLSFHAGGAVTVQGNATFVLDNAGTGGSAEGSSIGGSIGSDVLLNVGAASLTSGNRVIALIDSTEGGSIGGTATLAVDVTGAIDSQNGATLDILNTGRNGGGGGNIGGNANVLLTVGSISASGMFEAYITNDSGGRIGDDAVVTIGLNGAISVIEGAQNGAINLGIQNDSRFGFGAGQIGGSALLTLNAGNVASDGAVELNITNFGGGLIGDDASINIGVADITTGSVIDAAINNSRGGIGGNASVVFNAGNITGGEAANFYVDNSIPSLANAPAGGSASSIGGNATVSLSANDVSLATALELSIRNSAGFITGNASLSLDAHSISAESLLAVIANSGGTIAGASASIESQIATTATLSGNATFEIFGGSTPTGAINFNGGAYAVGGTFLTRVDGAGLIGFSNTSLMADTIKVGIFGTNGALNIGGGTFAANTAMRLYAQGSNGVINFVSNVALSSASSAIFIAANTVTIANGVTVTLGGDFTTIVYTNVPNYTGSGGNGTTTGHFVGAAQTAPFSQAPPFDSGADPAPPTLPQHNAGGSTAARPTRAPARTVMSEFATARMQSAALNARGRMLIDRERTPRTALNVADSTELLDLVDQAERTPDGRRAALNAARLRRARESKQVAAASPNATILPDGNLSHDTQTDSEARGTVRQPAEIRRPLVGGRVGARD